MKKFLSVFLFSMLSFSSFGNHISGGEMFYQYMGPGSSPGTKLYKITLRLFRDNLGGGAAMPGGVYIGIFNNDNSQAIGGSPFTVNITSSVSVPVTPPPACMVNPPTLDYSMGSYEFTVQLSTNAHGYTAAYQTCCRIFPL